MKFVMQWSSQAQRAWLALVRRAQRDGPLWLVHAVLDVAAYTIPGDSALGRSLRDPRVWPQGPDFARLSDQEIVQRGLGLGLLPYNVEVQVEAVAIREGARRVGERHIAAVLASQTDTLQRLLIDPDHLVSAVRTLELGESFLSPQMVNRWHGLIDTNIVIHYQDIWTVDWGQASGARPATVWVSGVLLDELDDMKWSTNRRPQVVGRARAFTRWFRERREQAITSDGSPLRNGAVMRAWSPPSHEYSAPDARHLEVADALVDHGVPIKVVTADQGQQLRARLGGIPVFEPPDQWRVHPEPDPSSSGSRTE